MGVCKRAERTLYGRRGFGLLYSEWYFVYWGTTTKQTQEVQNVTNNFSVLRLQRTVVRADHRHASIDNDGATVRTKVPAKHTAILVKCERHLTYQP